MAVQTIERETLRDILREILYEDRNLLERLVKEVIDEQNAPENGIYDFVIQVAAGNWNYDQILKWIQIHVIDL